MSDSDQVPLVVDNGSFTIKAGFAGDSEPTSVIPTIVGKPKDQVNSQWIKTYNIYRLEMNYDIKCEYSNADLSITASDSPNSCVISFTERHQQLRG